MCWLLLRCDFCCLGLGPKESKRQVNQVKNSWGSSFCCRTSWKFLRDALDFTWQTRIFLECHFREFGSQSCWWQCHLRNSLFMAVVNLHPQMYLPQNKGLMIRAYSPLVSRDKTLSTPYSGVRYDHFAINFTNSLDTHTTVLQPQKKATKPFLVPPPHFLRHFCFFWNIIFVVRFFSPPIKICPRSKGVWQPTSKISIDPHVKTNRFFQRWFHQAGQHRARRRGGPAELGSLAGYLIGQLLDTSGLPWGGGFLGAKTIGGWVLSTKDLPKILKGFFAKDVFFTKDS